MTDEDYYDICCVLSLCYRGVEVLSDLDLERILSFDMGWLSPEDAETAVSALIEKGWLIGSRDELTLAGEIEQKETPPGWFPRPTRLTEPVKFTVIKQDSTLSMDENKTEVAKQPATVSTAKPSSPELNDPREKLAGRLTKFIARQSKLSIEEINRRATRKKQALVYVSNWFCLALVAREQGIEMESIVSSLSS